jgi:hypothetical protein
MRLMYYEYPIEWYLYLDSDYNESRIKSNIIWRIKKRKKKKKDSNPRSEIYHSLFRNLGMM